MLDGLLGRGFAAKCKALIKLTRSRIDVIRRKRKATEKFLKKDIADLLANGLDTNAHGRAEGLLVELTLSSCYDFIDKSCEFVLKHLSVMQKVSGCPEECRNAVSSLMFAAARFSDLPELRDLRQIFQERYGNSMECYVNQEFAANVNSRSSTLEKKVHLMQEIASEFSIMWDARAFEQRMQKTSPLVQDRSNYYYNHLTDHNKPSLGNNAVMKGFKCDVPLQKSPGHPKDGHRFHNGKEADLLVRDDTSIQSESKLPRNGYGKINGREDVISRRNGHDNLLLGRLDSTTKKSDGGYWKEDCMLDSKGSGYSLQGKRAEHFDVGTKLHHDSWGNTTSEKVSHDTVAAKKPDLNPSHAEMHLKRNGNEPSTVNGPHDTVASKKPVLYPSHAEMHLKRNVNEPSTVNGLNDTLACKKPVLYPGHAEMHLKRNVKEPSTINRAGLPDFYDSERKVQKDETPRVKPFYNNALPPPYVKPNSKQKNSACEANTGPSDVRYGIPEHPSVCDQPHAATVSDRSQLSLDNSDADRQTSRHARRGRRSHEKELYDQEDMSQVPVLEPKSMWRKHSKSRSSHNDDGAEDAEVVTRKSRRSRKDESKPRHGLQTLFDDEQHRNDEEEKMIDKLLIHYSKKPSIPLPEKARRKSKSRHAHRMDDAVEETPEMVDLPPRSISLPREETGAEKVNKVFTRAATFQPDRSNEARHVHPNLPDYDDLAARIAALRGT